MNKINVTIRQTTEADSNVLARLRFAFRSSLNKAHEPDAAFVERCALWMDERLRYPSAWKSWIAECDGTAVGNIWVQLIEKIPNPVSEPERHAYVTNLFVREDFRCRGFGSKLLSTAVSWTQTQNVHAIFLWPTEHSRDFYREHGFEVRAELMEMVYCTTERRNSLDPPCTEERQSDEWINT